MLSRLLRRNDHHVDVAFGQPALSCGVLCPCPMRMLLLRRRPKEDQNEIGKNSRDPWWNCRGAGARCRVLLHVRSTHACARKATRNGYDAPGPGWPAGSKGTGGSRGSAIELRIFQVQRRSKTRVANKSVQVKVLRKALPLDDMIADHHHREPVAFPFGAKAG